MSEEWIDLHTHSTASDGTLTPLDLVRYASVKRLSAIALSDHDCVDGLDEAIEEGVRIGVEVIPSLEVSADYATGTMHILGFFVDRRQMEFRSRLKKLQDARNERNPKIVENLRAEGLEITMEDVVAASGGGLVGRPHFAKVLINKGYVSSMPEAFDRYLKKGAPGYVEKFRFSPEDTMNMIHGAGGVAVLAHPFTLFKSSPNKPSEVLEALLPTLTKAGLDGMEVLYSTYTDSQTRYYRKLADKFNLLPSGGSDYHGTHKPDIDLGVGLGRLRIPYDFIEALRAKAQEYGSAHVQSSSDSDA